MVQQGEEIPEQRGRVHKKTESQMMNKKLHQILPQIHGICDILKN